MHYTNLQEQNRRQLKLKVAFATSLLLVATVGAIYLAASGATPSSTNFVMEQDPKYDLFLQWKTLYAKNYLSEEEHSMKFETWSKNYDFVQEENKNPERTYRVGMNQYADLSAEEWKARVNSCMIKQTSRKNVEQIEVTGLPKSVDWRKKGAVTPIKNQQQCGSCWAFSTTGSLEGLNFITNKKLASFSEQQLVDCSQSYGNMGCNGGLMDYAFEYVAAKGIEAESTYPYTAQTGSCKYSASKTLFKNKGYTDVPQNNNNALAAAVANQPVSIGIEADTQQFQLYTGGVFNYAGCGTQIDHGVLLVGYGSSGKQDYWIVKNSWGPTWGESGYIRIAKQSGTGPGICGIATTASYPTDSSLSLTIPKEMIETREEILDTNRVSYPIPHNMEYEENEEGTEENKEGSEENTENEEGSEENTENEEGTEENKEWSEGSEEGSEGREEELDAPHNLNHPIRPENEEGSENHESEEGSENHEGEEGNENHEGEEGNENHEGEEGNENHEGEEGNENHEGEEGNENHEGEEGNENHEGEEGNENHEGEEGTENRENEENRIHPVGPEIPENEESKEGNEENAETEH